ncbi:TetR family transcriptional regulator [Staphylococcus shinii]|jgi:TetR/AcrR family transcriptional repressor of bet genes|uniref:TetR/AcrR family transcriptional regulator n=1 Tax=Staphylococcaceae TaxID=90964 RepID=UPI000D1DA6D2|nr:TetR/AcrR family transcriptional regulator [Staphylococcus shinii]PTH94997.1 TetR family transcriptional regulator [Staphylococcus shinii]RIM89012.1 TetR/AcrR family transcriptional regulator [Staphylococcus shinii]
MEKAHFIADTRREQMMDATIETLNEIGYKKVSLSKIAKRAGISTGLISYHFSGKDDLIQHTFVYLIQQELHYIQEKVKSIENSSKQLVAYINASLDYQYTKPKNNIALIEIVFNARNSDNIPYYLIDDEDEDEDLSENLLRGILTRGQISGCFSDFRPEIMTVMIQGIISESMLSPQKRLDGYKDEIVQNILKLVQ